MFHRDEPYNDLPPLPLADSVSVVTFQLLTMIFNVSGRPVHIVNVSGGLGQGWDP